MFEKTTFGIVISLTYCKYCSFHLGAAHFGLVVPESPASEPPAVRGIGCQHWVEHIPSQEAEARESGEGTSDGGNDEVRWQTRDRYQDYP